MKPLAFVIALFAFAVVWPDEHDAMYVSSKVLAAPEIRPEREEAVAGFGIGKSAALVVPERESQVAAPVLLAPSSKPEYALADISTNLLTLRECDKIKPNTLATINLSVDRRWYYRRVCVWRKSNGKQS